MVGSPADAALGLDAYLDTMIESAKLPIRRKAYDEIMEDDALMRFVLELLVGPWLAKSPTMIDD